MPDYLLLLLLACNTAEHFMAQRLGPETSPETDRIA